jgi:transcriptional regulator with XRE-family HTH domain
MLNRIELILKTQNLTPTQFADAIGIQRSGMSHILSGRNNPSLDFVMKVLNRFPEINAEWLLTGKNQMLNIGANAPTLPSLQTSQTNPKLPGFEWADESSACADFSADADFQSVPKNIVRSTDHKFAPTSASPVSVTEHEKNPPETKRNLTDIERIIVFFMDGTFKSYV